MSRVVGGGFARHGVCVAYTCHDTHKRTGIPTCEVVAKKSCGNVVGRTFSRVFFVRRVLDGSLPVEISRQTLYKQLEGGARFR